MHQCIMSLPVTTSESNRNRKYNSNLADFPFSQITSSNNTAVDWAILSKFGVEMDLNIGKRVLSLKLRPGSISNSMATIFKILEIDMTS